MDKLYTVETRQSGVSDQWKFFNVKWVNF